MGTPPVPTTKWLIWGEGKVGCLCSSIVSRVCDRLTAYATLAIELQNCTHNIVVVLENERRGYILCMFNSAVQAEARVESVHEQLSEMLWEIRSDDGPTTILFLLMLDRSPITTPCFQAWCLSDEECAARALSVDGRGGWGASGWPNKPGSLPPTLPWGDAPCFAGKTPGQAWGCQLSNNCTVNPTFCNFNMVRVFRFMTDAECNTHTCARSHTHNLHATDHSHATIPFVLACAFAIKRIDDAQSTHRYISRPVMAEAGQATSPNR